MPTLWSHILSKWPDSGVLSLIPVGNGQQLNFHHAPDFCSRGQSVCLSGSLLHLVDLELRLTGPRCLMVDLVGQT